MTLPSLYRGLESSPNNIEFSCDFPEKPRGMRLCAYHMLVARAKPKKKSKGGIILSADTIEADTFTDYIGKVLAVGPLFYNRLDLKEIPEEHKIKEGDIIGFKSYQGYRVCWQPIDENRLPIKDEDGDIIIHEYLVMRDIDAQIVYDDPSVVSEIRTFST